MTNLKESFLLDPEVAFLNHGSFGATPLPVLHAYQEWQRRLERQPVQFLAGQLPALLAEARRRLGAYLHVDGDDLAYVPNATFAVNVVARSLELGPADEVLSTDHEYGACDNVWGYLSGKRGFRYRQQPIDFPFASDAAIVEQFWQGVTPATRVIFLSHITSPTAVRFPIQTVCGRARQEGILTVIDGAHAPGQVPLNLPEIGPDFYFGNAHKWMCSPKGAAFLYARRDQQALIEPLVVGWGWGEHRVLSFGSDYLDYLQWLGTNDPSAYLAVPAAIDFQEEHDWPAVRTRCHGLLQQALQRIGALTGLPSLYPEDSYYHQMAVAGLPEIVDPAGFKRRLYDQFRVEVPLTQWRNRLFVRVSVQGYNEPGDIDRLIAGLEALLQAERLPPAEGAGC